MARPTRKEAAAAEAFRRLPSVEEVLRRPELAQIFEGLSAARRTELVRELLEEWRGQIRAGGLDAAGLDRRLAEDGLERALGEEVARDARRGLRRALNATGVVLHTGLGRAPVHPEAAARMAEVAGSYCLLEVDRESGQRNQRDARLGELLVRLTGAEAGIAVNNNAAAVLLVLSTFAGRRQPDDPAREVVVSRGELVEIGGSFRVPDVMIRAGVHLREVGTTNRTRMEDYRAALGPRTALLMKVHTSNFKITGFVHEVTEDELATLGAEHGVPTVFDLGSGLIEGDGEAMPPELEEEPRVRAAVTSGVDVVTFSGDKLFGGPQAGLIVGKREALAALRSNAMYRALRLDKVALAGLERTLELRLAGRGAELPTSRLLAATAAEVEPAARELAQALGAIDGLEAEVAEGLSQPGSGSAPGTFLATFVVRVRSAELSPDELAARLRRGEPALFTRIQDERVLLDPRTLLPGEAELVVQAFRAL